MNTELFARDGRAIPAAKIFRNSKGKPYYSYPRLCGRCGGVGGSDKWAHTGYVCFDCGGKGTTGTDYAPVYTADELAKLNARKAKADARRAEKAAAKAAAAQAEADARRATFLAEHGALLEAARPLAAGSEFVASILSQADAKAALSPAQVDALAKAVARHREAAARRAASRHVGKVGERLRAIPVTVERVASFDRPSFSGFGYETVWIVTMRDDAGNAIVSKSPSFYAEKGQRFALTATVKEHGEYKGEKQTLVQRCAIKETEAAA